MVLEPFARQTRDLIKRSGLLKRMRCSRDDDEFLLAAEHRKRTRTPPLATYPTGTPPRGNARTMTSGRLA